MPSPLVNIASTIKTATEERLFIEYGAVFTTSATPPPAIVFEDSESVNDFQSSLATSASQFGEFLIELQAEATSALVEASAETAKRRRTLSARAADSARRSYEDTLRLWQRNVTRGLDHWVEAGSLTAERAQALRVLDPGTQVEAVLGLEQTENLYFGTFFDRSILYSVAAPGASQHLSMLAFDVSEFADPLVEEVLNDVGWFRTVLHDLPHFTFLGRRIASLPSHGLIQVTRDYDIGSFAFWIPDAESLGLAR
jgi:hypothetical protein